MEWISVKERLPDMDNLSDPVDMKQNPKDKEFWSGFDAAISIVTSHVKEGGFFVTDEIAQMLVDEIMEEVEVYKSGN